MYKELRYIEEPSVTTVLDKVMKTPFWLEDWRAKFGLQRANELMKQAAKYGTLLHICLGEYLINRRFDFSTLEARIITYIRTERITFDTWDWQVKLEHDIYSFHHFCNEYQVEPIAIEIMLISSRLGYAGAIDLVCNMRIGTGENGKILKSDIKIDKNGEIKEDKTRQIYAIVDFKSGRHGFSESNEAQIQMYRNLFNENYPHIPIDRVYNWAPKDWDKTDSPAYFLKDQTKSVEKELIPLYVEIFERKELDAKNKNYHLINGVIELGYINDEKNLQVESYEDRAIKRLVKNAGATIKNPSQNIINKSDKLPAPKSIEESLNSFSELLKNHTTEEIKAELENKLNAKLAREKNEQMIEKKVIVPKLQEDIAEYLQTQNIAELMDNHQEEENQSEITKIHKLPVDGNEVINNIKKTTIKKEKLLKHSEIIQPEWTEADVKTSEESKTQENDTITQGVVITREPITFTSSQSNDNSEAETLNFDNNFGIQIETINQENVDKVTKNVESIYDNITNLFK
jgi:hypothetical protein